MTTTTHQILDRAQTMQKIKRIAYEIFENNFEEDEIVLAGIWDRGYILATMIEKELASICDIKIKIVKVMMDKFTPTQTEISLDCDPDYLQKKSIVLVDDVLNSGKTLIYSLKPFLDIEIKRLKIAVLVKRSYRSFPVSADYVGYSLATTVQEHIEVILDDDEKIGAYLF